MVQPNERPGKQENEGRPAAMDAHEEVASFGPANGPLPEMSSPAFESFRSLGEYRLLEKLGQGGMGAVFKARHTQLDRLVAVKVLTPALVVDPQAIARFEREMKAVGRLDHPNIVRAHDARQIDQTHVLVMEFVDGIDLAELVHRLGPLSIPDACELTRQAAIGLQYAHQNGLVHRDIKPSNLMLTRRGEVKILDLGLARIRSSEMPGDLMTATGTTMGTPDFMAPEQVTDSHLVDIRADIYSLGCTFYKLLSGRAPFESPEQPSAPLKMAAHVRDPVPPIRQFRSEVNERVVAVLGRMLSKQPDDRYSDPQELAEALKTDSSGCNLPILAGRAMSGRGVDETPVDGRPDDARSVDDRSVDDKAVGDTSDAAVDAPPATTAHFAGGATSPRTGIPAEAHGRSVRGTRRATRSVGIAGIAALAVLAAVGAWTIFKPSGEPGEVSARGDLDRQRLADGQDTASERNRPDQPSSSTPGESGESDNGSDHLGSPTAVAQDRPGVSDRIILSWPAPGELQPSLWIARTNGDRRMLLSKEDAAFDAEPTFSPDGQHVAFVRVDPSLRRSSLWVCRSDGSDVRELVSASGAGERLISPVWISENRIYYTRDPKINQIPDTEAWQVDLNGKAPHRVFDFQQVLENRAGLITDVSPDRSRLLVVVQRPGERLTSDVLTTNLVGGEMKMVWEDDCRDGRAIWAPDGRQIAWHHTYRETALGKLSPFGVAIAQLGSDGKWTGTLPPKKQTLVTPLAWSPNGDALLCARVLLGAGKKVRTVFFLIDGQFRPQRVLFELEGGRGLATGRHSGRLADWGTLPLDVISRLQAKK